jgi:D-arabinose 1-dehydrogenase-like Zn-dependent alcohol dehydrogenase
MKIEETSFTAYNLNNQPDAITAMLNGLSNDGKLMVIAGSPDPIAASPLQLIPGRRSIQGWPSGTARDSEDTMNFCVLTGIRPMIEEFPLADASRAYERMIRNQARFRVVLVNR